MPIFVKGDDVRSGTKVNACHGRLQAAWESMGQGHFVFYTERVISNFSSRCTFCN